MRTSQILQRVKINIGKTSYIHHEHWFDFEFQSHIINIRFDCVSKKLVGDKHKIRNNITEPSNVVDDQQQRRRSIDRS